MQHRRIAGCALWILGLAATSLAAEKATLPDAAERKQAALVRTLLQSGADVNATQPDGTTALHWAVYHDDVETARLLVRAGGRVDAENRNGVPPLSLACANANAEMVALLLEAGANPSRPLAGGETPLMTAARTGNLAIVQALLSRGADANAREQRQQTALMWAASEGHAPVVRALIAAGADVKATLPSGFTPWFFAVREGRIDVARALLAAGQDVNETLKPEERSEEGINNAAYKPVGKGTSALLLAVQNGHFELAIALVEAGADPNDHRTGFTPLHTMSWVRKPDASDSGDPSPIGSGRLTALEFVREIVKRGADVNHRLPSGPRVPNSATRVGTKGATPFLMAADRADTAMMRALLEVGADPTLPNGDGSTPLMVAAGLGTTSPEEEAGTEVEAVESVKLLLDRGADVNAVDSNGDTAMHGAAYGNFPAVIQLLAERGADPKIWGQANKQGRTPLFIAEGFRGGPPRPSRPTIDAVSQLMRTAGLSFEGQRPAIRDTYEVPAPSPAKTEPR